MITSVILTLEHSAEDYNSCYCCIYIVGLYSFIRQHISVLCVNCVRLSRSVCTYMLPHYYRKSRNREKNVSFSLRKHRASRWFSNLYTKTKIDHVKKYDSMRSSVKFVTAVEQKGLKWPNNRSNSFSTPGVRRSNLNDNYEFLRRALFSE